MKTRIQILTILLMGFSLASFKMQDARYNCDDKNNCLELNGEFFSVDFTYNSDSTFKSYYISTDSEPFYISTPGLLEYIPCQSLETPTTIYLDYPVDSVRVDFNMGKIQLKDGKIPEELKLTLTVDGKYCWTDRIQSVFISDKSKSYGIGIIKQLNRLLDHNKDNIPKYVLLKQIEFFGPNIKDCYLDSSFLFEIE